MNPARPTRRLARRIAARNELATKRAAWADGYAEWADQAQRALAEKLETIPSAVDRAHCTIQWVGSVAEETCEGIALGAITGHEDAANDVANWLIGLALAAVAEAVRSTTAIDTLVEGVREVVAEDGAPLIVAVAEIAPALTWQLELAVATDTHNVRRIRHLKCSAPDYSTRAYARIYDKAYRRAVNRRRSRLLASTRCADQVVAKRFDGLHVRHKRRGPPCRRVSRITRSAPIGANAPPVAYPLPEGRHTSSLVTHDTTNARAFPGGQRTRRTGT